MKRLITIIFALTFVSCNRNLGNQLNHSTKSSLEGEFLIEGVSTSTPMAGSAMSATGIGFTNKITASIKGQSVEVKVESEKLITVTIPAHITGLSSLIVTDGRKSTAVPILITKTDALMLLDGNSETLCAGEDAIDLDGNIITGTKNCAEKLESCDDDPNEAYD